MKKTFKLVLLIAVLTLGLFVLTGCGKKETEKKFDLTPYAGTYEGQYTKFVGDPDTKKDLSDTFSVELKADGTGTSNRNGASYKMTWNFDGEKFEMTEKFGGLTIDYTGTLKDGKLDLFNGDPEKLLTCEYVYKMK